MPVATPDLDEMLETIVEQGLDEPYDVVLHNDSVNTFEYVIACLVKILNFSPRQAAETALAVHQDGSAVVWSGPRDEAVTIARKLQSMSLTATCRKVR